MSGPSKIGSSSPAQAVPQTPGRSESDPKLSPVPELNSHGTREGLAAQSGGKIGAGTEPEILTGRRGLDAGFKRLEEFLAPFLKPNGE